MDSVTMPGEVMVIACTVLMLLFSVNHGLDYPFANHSEDEEDNTLLHMTEFLEESTLDVESKTRTALHTFRLSNVFSFLDDDLGYWVKPRSMAWFSCFLFD